MRRLTISVALAAVLAVTAVSQAVEFRRLGMLSDGIMSRVYDVSGDGRVAVGICRKTDGWEAFRWTLQDQMVGLGDLPGGSVYSEANAASFDGSVIVGTSSDSTGYQAVRWSLGQDGWDIDPLYPGHCMGVSDDAAVITGIGYPSGEPSRGFRWTAAGVSLLPNLPDGDRFWYPSGISPDGSTIVGMTISSSSDDNQAVRWTAAEGSVGIGDLPGGEVYGWGYGASEDGSVIVGRSKSAAGEEPFRWTAEDDMVGLGDLPGGEYNGFAWDVSRDGSIVYGFSESDLGHQAIVWTEEDGMQILQDVLQSEYGLELPGWQLTVAKAVSADGLVIVGDGINPDGAEEGWMLIVPEPSTWSMLALAGLGYLSSGGNDVRPDVSRL